MVCSSGGRWGRGLCDGDSYRVRKGETGMFRTPLQDVDFQQVETFCRVWPEGVCVEYKQKITQIPKIVSSFANTMGGIWLIGVKTDR
jgi:hypothetical protein